MSEMKDLKRKREGDLLEKANNDASTAAYKAFFFKNKDAAL
jgi:hypothetical protein